MFLDFRPLLCKCSIVYLVIGALQMFFDDDDDDITEKKQRLDNG